MPSFEVRTSGHAYQNIVERGALLRFAGLPENFIVVNPQFAGSDFVGNFSNSTYHSLQLNATKRFSSGFTFLSNYTLSRTLGDLEGESQDLLHSYRTGRNRRVGVAVGFVSCQP